MLVSHTSFISMSWAVLPLIICVHAFTVSGHLLQFPVPALHPPAAVVALLDQHLWMYKCSNSTTHGIFVPMRFNEGMNVQNSMQGFSLPLEVSVNQVNKSCRWVQVTLTTSGTWWGFILLRYSSLMLELAKSNLQDKKKINHWPLFHYLLLLLFIHCYPSVLRTYPSTRSPILRRWPRNVRQWYCWLVFISDVFWTHTSARVCCIHTNTKREGKIQNV